MAVYKSIYCYPFSENANLASVFPYYDVNGVKRLGEPFYFSCRVDSSNKNIIGYSIKIYDDSGAVVFPVGGGDPKVSPVAELPKFEEDDSINSGLNGTYLKIPFFQEYDNYKTSGSPYTGSYNALYCNETDYYTDYFMVDLILGAKFPVPVTGEVESTAGWDNCWTGWNAANWTDSLYPEIIDGKTWDGFLNGVKVTRDHVIAACVRGPNSSSDEWHLFRLNADGNGLDMISDPTAANVGVRAWAASQYYRSGTVVSYAGRLYQAITDVPDTRVRPPHLDTSYWVRVTWTSLTHACFVRYGSHTGIYALAPTVSASGDGRAEKLTGFWFPATGGDPIPQFLMDGSSYSWEITLYQGPGIGSVSGLLKENNNSAANLDKFPKLYDLDIFKIPGNWFDMSLGEGTVLGTNGQRLQLSDITRTMLPGEGMDVIPLLRDKFVEIGYLEQENNHRYRSGSRFHAALSSNVTSYDSSLGHAYLPEQQVDPVLFTWKTPASVISSNKMYSSCAFYQYSSDENQILNRDKVGYLVEVNVDLSESSSAYAEGDRVLLIGQTLKSQNGVYVYHVDTVGGYHYVRAPDFDTWADYIGRVIFVSETKQNYSNSASAGGTLDSTPLYFFIQQPIQLFPLSAFEQRTLQGVVLLQAHHLRDSTPYYPGQQSGQSDDGYYILGEYEELSGIGRSYRGYVALKSVSGYWESIANTFDPMTTAFSFDSGAGQEYIEAVRQKGAEYFYLPVQLHTTYSEPAGRATKENLKKDIIAGLFPFLSHRVAKMLFNDFTTTYVSPNSLLAPGMMLRFLNGCTTKLVTNDFVSALRVHAVNKKFWCIEHEELSHEEYNYSSGVYVPTYVLKAYDDGQGSPYKYQILACFLPGTENSFTDYTVPCVLIEGVQDGQISTEDSSLFAQGSYYQGQNRSWESYRFVLKDVDGEVLQDTGEKYDKNISTWFLGLEYDREYSIALIVTDDIGYRSTYTVPLHTRSREFQYPYSGSLTAELDCSTHSVLITYNGASLPSFENGTLSLYRREIGSFARPACDGTSRIEYASWYGDWHPVAINTEEFSIRDFNVAQGHSYQYAIFPKDLNHRQLYANLDYDNFNVLTSETSPDGPAFMVQPALGGTETRRFLTRSGEGKPVAVAWDEWAIVDLVPEDSKALLNGAYVEVPAIKKKYRALYENMWLLKFGAEMGALEQNLTRGETQTLGRYDRIGYSPRNFTSGSVSCYLGSEIAPFYRQGYVERTAAARSYPTSTNEASKMVALWKAFAQSSNPKLLTDRKGQKWIVQIVSTNITPQESYVGLPCRISFNWKQIASCDDDIIIYGDGEANVPPGKKPVWEPIFDYGRR